MVHQLGNLPVYKIAPESGSGQSHVVHWNLLLPTGELVGSPLPETRSQEDRPHYRRRLPVNESAVVPAAPPKESDSDSDWWYPAEFHPTLDLPPLRVKETWELLPVEPHLAGPMRGMTPLHALEEKPFLGPQLKAVGSL